MDISFKDIEMEKEKYVITTNTRTIQELSKVVGGDGLALFLYMHGKGIKWQWRDDRMAKDLGWSVSKLRRIRNKLKDHKYLYWFHNKGNTYTYIGKRQYEIGIADEQSEKFIQVINEITGEVSYEEPRKLKF